MSSRSHQPSKYDYPNDHDAPDDPDDYDAPDAHIGRANHDADDSHPDHTGLQIISYHFIHHYADYDHNPR